MNFWEGLIVALENLRASKMRSALTMLGIVIGVGSVIAVVAIGQGGRAAVMGEFNKYGSNLLAFYYKADSARNGQVVVNGGDMLTVRDAEDIKRQVPGLEAVAPGVQGQAEARANKVKKTLMLTATTEAYQRVTTVDLVAGRFFSEAEDRGRMKVIIVEQNLVKELFHTESGIGRRIYINDIPYKIIGITKSQTASFNFGPTTYTGYLPLDTWQYDGDSTAEPGVVNWIQAKMADGAKEQQIQDKALALLGQRHHNKDKYGVESLDQIKGQVDKATGILELIIGSIAAISLLVGGIGVMNIMLVSVTERTREIGIRKALGASHGDILRQFLVESALLCLFGGAFGILLGTGGAYIIAKFAKWPPLVSLGTVGIAVGFSLTVGLFFGLYPASRAARLDPIEALRYE